MPRMPLSGVRSSWLTVARNRDFASLAASARSPAAAAAFSSHTSSRSRSHSRTVVASVSERLSAKASRRPKAKPTISAATTAIPAARRVSIMNPVRRAGTRRSGQDERSW